MRVLLVDVDSKIPNLALMKISAYHKNMGDTVGFNITNPDVVYVSCLFTKNKEQSLGIRKLYPNVEIRFGGSGINNNKLPDLLEFQYPDYDLYPSTYSQGYTTRGCIRKCPWCIVQDKEGKHERQLHAALFHDNRFKTIMIMDNNWLADKDWFFSNTDYILDEKLKIIEHGMDIRLVNKEIAYQLNQLRWEKPMKFAFDQPRDEKAVIKGIKILNDVGIDLKHKVQFYVLVGYNTTHEEDLHRLRLLRKQGVGAYVMQYSRNANTRKLARWANRKHFFFKCDYNEFQPNLRLKKL